MTPIACARLTGLQLVLAPLLVAGYAFAFVGPDLTTDRSFTVLSPVDGAEIGDQVTLRWSGYEGATSYAVVVDAALPVPGAVVEAGDRTVMLTGREVTLALGAATSGSPSARNFHTLWVVPVDADGRRLGEDSADVHVRGAR